MVEEGSEIMIHYWVNHYTMNFFETACNMVLEKGKYPFTTVRKPVTCGNCLRTKLVKS